MTHHNLQINQIIHYPEANDTSQPTHKSYHTFDLFVGCEVSLASQ
jgi:hypothetical protein